MLVLLLIMVGRPATGTPGLIPIKGRDEDDCNGTCDPEGGSLDGPGLEGETDCRRVRQPGPLEVEAAGGPARLLIEGGMIGLVLGPGDDVGGEVDAITELMEAVIEFIRTVGGGGGGGCNVEGASEDDSGIQILVLSLQA